MTSLELSREDATVLANDPDVAAYFEQAITAHPQVTRQMAHWISGELFAALNRDGLTIDTCPITPQQMGQLVLRIVDGTLSGRLGKQVFQTMWSSRRDADEIIEAQGLRQVSDTHLIEVAVREVLENNPEQVAQVRAGKEKVLAFLVGQVMKRTGGKANPAIVNQLIKTALSN